MWGGNQNSFKMKPLGKTQSSPPTGSDLNALAFEHGDCQLLSGCAGKVGRQLLAPTRRRQLAQVQSILEEGKGGKLVKTPTQPCRKQRNLFCNVPMLSGSYAHHGTMSAGAQRGASGLARPYGPLTPRQAPVDSIDDGWAICPRTWLGFHCGSCSQWYRMPLPLATVLCSSGRKGSLFRDALNLGDCLLVKMPPKGASPCIF